MRTLLLFCVIAAIGWAAAIPIGIEDVDGVSYCCDAIK